jgi:ribosomal-protein-alanine N-acetyltransferase
MLASDIDRVLEITDNLAQASRWAREVYETAIRPGSAPRRVALVAEEPALGIVGFTVACVVTPEAELETIGVTAAQQRSGIGRQLLGETKRILGGLGVTKVLLEVRESNRAARQLYKAAGFDETGRRASYYVDPKEDAIVMSLKLAD